MKKASLNFNMFNMRGGTFLSLFLMLFIPLLFIIGFYSREETHVFLNGFHSPFLDTVMKYWTFLGDGMFQVYIVVILLFVSIRFAATGLTAFLLGGLSVQFLKRVVFSDMVRPVKYFERMGINYDLHLVEGVDMHYWLSFPSGHAATAFAMFFAFALLTRNRVVQLFLLVISMGVAYSRVYLSQHFLMDVVVAAFLGVFMGWMGYFLIQKIEKAWMEGSIVEIIKR
ncbi:MAG: phosphatase PAP2 family protein [Bacteroidales bacterium]|nr:phosphatase PAP2 family protein [Bacteroidales bacterium]